MYEIISYKQVILNKTIMNSTKKIDFISQWIKKYVNNMQNPARTLVVGFLEVLILRLLVHCHL